MELLAEDGRSPYVRHPIHGDQIRLVHLQPSSNLEDRVAATMSVVPLGNPGKFHAISYAWGSPVCDDYIVCDGARLPVTSNLHAGLKRIREKMAVEQVDRIPPKWFMPTIWADAVCIDQGNDVEKTSQVQRMATIYQKAVSLIIWLGEADHQEGVDVCAALRGLRPHDEAASAVQALIKRPWFTRRWIIQEVFSKRIRHVLLGGSRFAFDELLANTDKMGSLTPGSFVGTIFWRKSSTNMNARSNLIDNWPRPKLHMPPLMNNLIAYRSTVCANDLDRVYSLLSISCEHPTFGDDIEWPEVDYSISPHRLYRSVSQCYFEKGWARLSNAKWNSGAQERNLFRKSLVMATATAYANSSVLASWVPDWAVEAHYRSESHQRLAEIWHEGDEVFNVRNEFHETVDRVVVRKDELHLRGWLFRTCDHGMVRCSCSMGRRLLGELGPICGQAANVRWFTESWPVVDAENGEVAFYMQGWRFAFTLLPALKHGCYRLASCFLIVDLLELPVDAGSRLPLVEDEVTAWVLGFGNSLKPDALTTVVIV